MNENLIFLALHAEIDRLKALIAELAEAYSLHTFADDPLLVRADEATK